MASIVVRNLSDATHRALKARAKAHHRSTEAEVRAILDEAVARPGDEVGLGTLLAAISREAGPGPDFEIVRDQDEREPLDFA